MDSKLRSTEKVTFLPRYPETDTAVPETCDAGSN